MVRKLHPPLVSARTVERERLFERLRDGQGRRLTLVACPAGFGKSTLLAAWRETEMERRPVAWVTLDEGDDDAVVLWTHVIEALGLPAPAPTAPLREVVLPQVFNALAARGEVALVLDDFHRISSATTRESVAWFVTRLPASVQLIVSTRTEGWPAGIYLAALSLAGTADKHGLVTAFDGTSAHVVDFLAGEVLAAHPPELQRFMLRTSVLERLCAPLCDAVLGEPGSAQALDSLARTNLFLLGLDDRRRWCRFHHLFAQILHVELERREPELVPELHRRAFAWHAELGTTDEAIHHVVAARAFPV